MLFISRHVGVDWFGVVDTDDGSEEFIDRVGLVRADEFGVEIHGISHLPNGRIDSITPYQSLNTFTALQTKLKLLSHVDVRVYDGAITYLYWDSAYVPKNISIRLSDFGTSVEDCIFAENPCSYGGTVTIIVDNKITDVSEYAFRMDEYGWSVEMSGLGHKGLGVIFDLREVESDDIRRWIYSQLDAYAGDSFECIIDSDFHKAEMRDYLGRA